MRTPLRSPEGGAFDHIEVLTNEKATLAAITRGLRSFVQDAAEEDLVVIYLAGHGKPEHAVRHRRGSCTRLGQVVGERADEEDAAAPAREEPSPQRGLDRGLGKPACTEIGGGDDSTRAGCPLHQLEVAVFAQCTTPRNRLCGTRKPAYGLRTVDPKRIATARKALRIGHGSPSEPWNPPKPARCADLWLFLQ